MHNVRLKLTLINLVITALTIVSIAVAGAEIPTKPFTNVNDYASVLSNNQITALQKQVDSLKPKLIVGVAIVKNMGGLEILEFSQETYQKWGIGSKSESNGVLIVIALQERKVRIHTGYGAEAILPDHVTLDIIKKAVPDLAKSRYYEGLSIMIKLVGEKII